MATPHARSETAVARPRLEIAVGLRRRLSAEPDSRARKDAWHVFEFKTEHERRSVRRKAAELTANDKIDVCRGCLRSWSSLPTPLTYRWCDPSRGSGRCIPGWLHGSCSSASGLGFNWVIGFFVISGYCIQLSVSRSIEGNTRFRLFALPGSAAVAHPAALCPGTGLRGVGRVAHRPGDGRGTGSTESTPSTVSRSFFLVQNLTQTFGSYAAVVEHHQRDVLLRVLWRDRVGQRSSSAAAPTLLGMWLCLVIAHPDGCHLLRGRADAHSPHRGFAVWARGHLVSGCSRRRLPASPPPVALGQSSISVLVGAARRRRFACGSSQRSIIQVAFWSWSGSHSF